MKNTKNIYTLKDFDREWSDCEFFALNCLGFLKDGLALLVNFDTGVLTLLLHVSYL